MPTTSLLVADSQELIRLGVRAMLEGTSVKIVGEAIDAKSKLTLARKHKPAVVLLAMHLSWRERSRSRCPALRRRR